MHKFGSRRGSHADEENPYWISFSDIMAGLLVIFILASVALIMELMEKQEDFDLSIQELKKGLRVKKNIVNEIKDELEKKNIHVIISENDSVMRIPEEVLTFKQGKYNVPGSALYRRNALEIGRVLYAAIAKNKRWEYLDTIFIEGHTDRVPYRDKAIQGNWGLSTFRAISIWSYWNDQLPANKKLDGLLNHDGKKLFSVSGYAETRPTPETLETPNSPASLKKNRRIDIRFTVKRPSLENYETVKENQ